MNAERTEYLRRELDMERINMSELSEIESAFDEIPDERLRDRRENAMASDMLEELEMMAPHDHCLLCAAGVMDAHLIEPYHACPTCGMGMSHDDGQGFPSDCEACSDNAETEETS